MQHNHIEHTYSAPRRGVRLVVGLVALVTVLGLLLALVLVLRDTFDPAARARASEAAYQASLQHARLWWLDDVTAVLWRLVPFAVVGVGLALAWRRFGSHEYIKAYHVTQHAKALRSPGPQTLTYSPHITGGAPAALPDVAQLDAPVLGAPAFAELVASGLVGPGAPLLLGFASDGKPITGSWRDLYSSAVGGLPGTGKTTTLRFLAAQAALHGARFAILDPHAGAGDESLATTLAPLSSSFLAAPAASEDEMRHTMGLVRLLVDRRLAGDADRAPVLLAVDEFSRLMARSELAPELSGLLEYIAQEGRKVGVFALLSGQVWLASRSGGSELRYSLASAFVHRMHRKQASILLPQGEGVAAERLAPGEALLLSTSGDVQKVKIPLTTAADIERLGWSVGSPSGCLEDATSDVKNESLQTPKLLSPDAARAASLFLAGTAPSEIVYQLRGVKSSGGRPYRDALNEVYDLLREGLA